jgi:hypothetical protein
MARREMTQADAAEMILTELRRPLHRNELTAEMIRRKLPVWGAGAPKKTPHESVGRALTQEIARRGDEARFEFVDGKGSGVFQLRRRPTAGASVRVAPDRSKSSRPVVLDERLLGRIQRTGQPPEDFVRAAVLRALSECEVNEKEEAHRRGYAQHPVQTDEFSAMDPAAWDEI